MSPIQCFKNSTSLMPEKFSAKTLLKFVKVVKPVLRLMKRKHRTNAVTPSSCNYDVVESFQNDVNESELFQLDFKFFEDSATSEADENLRNEELEKRLLGELEKEDTERTPPVCPLQKKWGKFGWAPRADFDICKRGDEYVTGEQRAEQQVPAAMI